MNEKIVELYGQAWTYACDASKDYPHEDFITDSVRFKNLHIEKFAEMIVAECIDIISPYTVRMNKPGEIGHPIQEIKEHFGVKE